MSILSSVKRVLRRRGDHCTAILVAARTRSWQSSEA